MAKKLLVTDDAAIMRELIKDALLEAGWEIVGEAANGQEAIERFQELRPDAMTLDIVMPEYDGLHALRGVLAHDPDAKIVVVSALSQKDLLREAFKIGASDFVCKPFDRQNLVETLEKLVPETTPA